MDLHFIVIIPHSNPVASQNNAAEIVTTPN